MKEAMRKLSKRKESKKKLGMIPSFMKDSNLNQQLKAPRILFNNSSTNRGEMLPLFSQQVLNTDMHLEKDINYLGFYEKFDLDYIQHSSEKERDMRREEEAELHLQNLINAKDESEDEPKGKSIK